jgi:lipopolysaccharide/colanic/teichoic acid biosynthesis glycosyltransferase
MKRFLDIIISLSMVVLTSPILIVTAILIYLSDPGSIFYKSYRMGKNKKIFLIYKFRSMKINKKNDSQITASNDPRIFNIGKLIRKIKIDEMPQLLNILKGEMSFIGPRPESIEIVKKYYKKNGEKTLTVLPGLASPGSIYNYTHGEKILKTSNTLSIYTSELLPIKLSLDCIYIENKSIIYDIRLVFRTLSTIFLQLVGKKDFKLPPEFIKAKEILSL